MGQGYILSCSASGHFGSFRARISVKIGNSKTADHITDIAKLSDIMDTGTLISDALRVPSIL